MTKTSATLIATATMGLEKVVANELKNLGYDNIRISNGRVELEGQLSDVCNLNLWLRTADRVLLRIGEFKARTFDDLFEKTMALDWGHYIGPKDAFPVAHVSSVKSTLFSKSDCQAIVKKAVVENLRKYHKVRLLQEDGAQYSIRLQILKDTVTLSLDTSGWGLHRRGYRAQGAKAPLRETLAAALVLLSHWRGDRALIDPMCGTGTILIEAARIARRIAPGLDRNFAAERWNCVPPKLWKEARAKAKAQILKDAVYRIYGSDINSRTLKIARDNIRIAGLKDIYVQTLSIKEIRSKYKIGKIITNPPYGERLNEIRDAEKLYMDMKDCFTERFAEWQYYVLTANERFEKYFGKQATKKRKLYNGGIKCWYYMYY